jgi:K+-transporting ATPase KdpF subunit
MGTGCQQKGMTGLGQGEDKTMMDYIGTGLVALALLVYLLYALLKPERF